ncbi:MAG: NUDIX domain-containing protein [Nitrososphaerales archaeon]
MSRSKSKSAEAEKSPIPTVDVIVRKGGSIVLEKRARPPFEGWYSLPGGHVEYGETVEAAALRELKEETSLDAKLVTIFGVYSDPRRDPRGQRISSVFVADWTAGEIRAGDDAKSAEWVGEDHLLDDINLAFDHHQILKDYVEWISRGQAQTYWSTRH